MKEQIESRIRSILLDVDSIRLTGINTNYDLTNLSSTTEITFSINTLTINSVLSIKPNGEGFEFNLSNNINFVGYKTVEIKRINGIIENIEIRLENDNQLQMFHLGVGGLNVH